MRPLVWRHPEWWSLGISVAAWAVLVGRAVLGSTDHYLGGGWVAWLQGFLVWLLMVLAMMLPLVVFSIRVTAARSLWRRRDRAISGFLIGYLGPWLLAGAVASVLDVTLGLERWIHLLPWLGGVGFGIAALWHLAPVRQRAVRSCHRTVPLAPSGRRADLDCLRYGWLTGRNCLLSCWAVMAACVLAQHSLPAMLCAAAITTAERYLIRPRQRTMFSPLLGVALVYGILGLSG